jgi:hypothetical protein
VTIRTRLSRLEQLTHDKGRIVICHRHGSEDDARIAAKRAEAQKTGDLLVVINGFSRFDGIKGAEVGSPSAQA